MDRASDLRLRRGAADKAVVAAIAVEQFSPGLVLVCPEVREWALGALC